MVGGRAVFLTLLNVSLVLILVYLFIVSRSGVLFGRSLQSKKPRAPIANDFLQSVHFADVAPKGPAEDSEQEVFQEMEMAALDEGHTLSSFSFESTSDATSLAFLGSRESTLNSSVTASISTVLKFRNTMAERFRRRRDLMTNTCENHRDQFPQDARVAFEKALFYVDKYKFLTCLSPKVGTTTWKTHLLRMINLKSIHKSPHFYNRQIGVFYNKGIKLAYKQAGDTSTRVITVRHPLSRLASAFKNKLGDGEAIVPPSHHIYDIFKQVMELHKQKAFRHAPNQVTFLQFMNFVTSQVRTRSVNPHWRPYLWTCQPCGIRYDYIVKLETFDDDLNYIASELGIKEINTNLRENQSPVPEAEVTDYVKYFEDLPPAMLKKVYEAYKYDFLLFDYEVPEFMLKAAATGQ